MSMVRSLSVVLLITTLASCGYKDKNECVVAEQQKGAGASRVDIYRYCSSLFKEGNAITRKIRLEEGRDFKKTVDKNRLSVQNFSDRSISIVKVQLSSKNCEEMGNADWDELPNHMAGRFISSGQNSFVVSFGEGWQCYRLWVGYTQY